MLPRWVEGRIRWIDKRVLYIVYNECYIQGGQPGDKLKDMHQCEQIHGRERKWSRREQGRAVVGKRWVQCFIFVMASVHIGKLSYMTTRRRVRTSEAPPGATI